MKINIKALIEEMTLEEKIGMCHGAELFRTAGVERLGVPPLVMSDGPMGVRKEYEGTSWTALDYSDDYSTYLPCNTALAATWNRNLAYESGKILGEEARGRGKDIILAPGINIARSPLCGRNFEYMTEDPYLAGELAVPFIQGVEESDVAACVKHLAVNNQETERLEVNVELSERALREIYLPAFEAAVKRGKSKTIMSAYNRLRGAHCSESSYLLKDILRNEWGYDGVVISDWGAVHKTYEAAMNGLDIEMNVSATSDEYFMAAPLIEAVRKGEVAENIIDEKVTHILQLMVKLNMFSEDRKSGAHNKRENREKILEVARQSIVLLKNKEKLLPLNQKKIGKLAIIGDNAERLHAGGGDSAQIKALYEISPLMGIKMYLGGNTQVAFARGYSEKEEEKQQLLTEAVEAARAADTVIMVGGLTHLLDSEGIDRDDITLPYGQDELIKHLIEVNKNTVVVMLSGSQVGMNKWINKASTVVQTWYTGMEGGYALAEVLFGEVNPSGKLPVTFPLESADWPAHKLGEFPGGKSVHYNEGVFVGYRYFNTHKSPVLFEFGYGMSYTTFEYSDLQIQRKEKDEGINVSFKITNTGDYRGEETAQLYVQRNILKEGTVFRELKQFEKVYLEIGETKTVTFNTNAHAFEVYNEAAQKWVLEDEDCSIAIGASVEDIRLSAALILQ